MDVENKLDLPLDELIKMGNNTENTIPPTTDSNNNDSKRSGNNHSSSNNRNSSRRQTSNTRASRASTPYDNTTGRSYRSWTNDGGLSPKNNQQNGSSFNENASSVRRDQFVNDDMEIKFLTSHFVAGLLIGKGGTRIRKFAGMTSTFIAISSPDELYPGTTFRFITVRGQLDDVIRVISILWEVVALEQTEMSLGSRNIWVPTSHMSHIMDHVQVEGKLVVPAASVGRIIGRDMVAIKAMVDSTGATVHFAKRFEPSLPGQSDRVVTIGGQVISCAEVSALIMEKVKTYLEDKAYAIATGTTILSNNMIDLDLFASQYKSNYPQTHTNLYRDRDRDRERERDRDHYRERDRDFDRDRDRDRDRERDRDRDRDRDRNHYRDRETNTHSRYTPAVGSLRQPSTHKAFTTQSAPFYRPRPDNYDSDDEQSASLDPGFVGHGGFTSSSHHTGREVRKVQLTGGSDALNAGGGISVSMVSRVDNTTNSMRRSSIPQGISGGAEVVSASTTVSLAVPNALIGNIIGFKGNMLRQIIAQTRADVKVAPWGEFVPGTENRLVTVTGDPGAVAEACQLVNNLLDNKN